MEYSQTELRKLFDTLPQELKETLLSEETADRIREICNRHKVEEKDVPRIAKLIGKMLMGLLPPEEFLETLKKEIGLNEEDSKNISREVNRLILFPVKQSLAEFYNEIKFAPGGRLEKETKPEKESTVAEKETKEKEKVNDDIYREPIE
jgi:hypothetical protein